MYMNKNVGLHLNITQIHCCHIKHTSFKQKMNRLVHSLLHFINVRHRPTLEMYLNFATRKFPLSQKFAFNPIWIRIPYRRISNLGKEETNLLLCITSKIHHIWNVTFFPSMNNSCGEAIEIRNTYSRLRRTLLGLLLYTSLNTRL